MMAIWTEADELGGGLDWHLVQNSFVTLFRRPEVLAATTDWLTAHGYDVRTLDAAWRDELAMHESLALTLEFPAYYGHNLNALNDCLSDVAAATYGVRPEARGLVLVLTRYDRFARVDPHAAQTVLDIFARQARLAALFGRRMLCLVQSDHPATEFTAVGATAVAWNLNEGRTDQRGQP